VPQLAPHYITMKRLIRYFTRWAWRPVINEFVLRQVRAERTANHLAEALGTIAYTKGCIPVSVARRAINKFKEAKVKP
jgi:hypothetical protein